MMRTRGFKPFCCVFAVATALMAAGPSLSAQQPAAPNTAQPAAPQPAMPQQTAQPVPKQTPSSSPVVLTPAERSPEATHITEDELRRQLLGKTFYLRGGYIDSRLAFNEQGQLNGSSPKSSYTLSLIEIQHVRLESHRLELEAVRYGLHFLGALAPENQIEAVDRVRLTKKKKPLVITIDREEVVKPKKEKEKSEKKRAPQSGSTAGQSATSSAQTQNPEQPPVETNRRGVAITTSQAHANRALMQALDRVLAAGIDDRLIATLPDYWQLFYRAAARDQNFKPTNPAILRQNEVDQKAKLIHAIEPPSNDYAQANSVAGMALYHVVVGIDGKPQQIAVGRPIGFGLDENAVESIRKATFQPAIKDGKPVPVLTDVLVQFRIYSQRTAATSIEPILPPGAAPATADAPILPGPYTANEPRPSVQPEPASQAKPEPASEAQPASQPQPGSQPQ